MEIVQDLGIRDKLGESLFRDFKLPKDPDATYDMVLKLDPWNPMHVESVDRLMRQQAIIHGKIFPDGRARQLIENISEGKCHAFLCVRTDNETGEEKGVALVTGMNDVMPVGPVLYLEDIIVDKEMRRRGIGRASFHQFVVFADIMKNNGVLFRSKRDNIGAHDFFNTFGSLRQPLISLVSNDFSKFPTPDLMEIPMSQEEISLPKNIRFLSSDDRTLVTRIVDLFDGTLRLSDRMLIPEIAMNMGQNISVNGQSIKLKDLAMKASSWSSVNSSVFPKVMGLAVVENDDVKSAAIIGPNFGTIFSAKNSVVNIMSVQSYNGSEAGPNPDIVALLDGIRYVHRYVMRNSGEIYLQQSSPIPSKWGNISMALELAGCRPVKSDGSTMISGLLSGSDYRNAVKEATERYKAHPARDVVCAEGYATLNCKGSYIKEARP